MVTVVSGLFVEICLLFTLSNMMVLSSFSVKIVFRKTEWQWETQKKSGKREVGKDKWYNQMGQVGTGWSTWNKWDRDRGVSILGGTRWDWDRGVFKLGGTGWDSEQVSVQLNQSTCPKVGLQGRGKFPWRLPFYPSNHVLDKQKLLVLSDFW